MFFALPIRDEPNPPGVPWVTYSLIAVNAVVFLAISFPLTLGGVDPSDPALAEYLHIMSRELNVPISVLAPRTSAYDLFTFQWGFRPGAASAVTLFTSMFLHAGWMHLLGNMLMLWIFGDNVEFHFGRVKYLLGYLATGVVATAFFTLFRADSMIPMVGASGAISGVLGCYFLWFPRNRVKLLTVFIWFINVVSVPARWVLGFYLVIDNILPFLMSTGGAGVAYGAHIGGFVGGMVLAFAYGRLRDRASLGPREAGGSRSRATTPRSVFRQALADDAYDAALREYTLMSPLERNSLSDLDVFELADGLTDGQRFDAGLAVLQRFISTHPNSPALAAAHLRAGLINLRGLGRPTAGYQHLLTVLDLNPSREVERAARAGLAEIRQARGVLH